MNSEEIVLFESSDGSLHTISLTPEQLTELGLQIQYNSPNPAADDRNLKINQIPVEISGINASDEVISITSQSDTTTIGTNTKYIQSNYVVDESKIDSSKFVNVEESTAIVNIGHLQNVVRLSDITPKKGQRGFQLITDHISPDNWISKKSNILTTDGIMINKHPSNVAASSNDFVWKKNGFLPKNKAILAASNKITPGQFMISHNEICSSVVLDNSQNQQVPQISNNNNVANLNSEIFSNQNQILVQNVATHEDLSKITKPKNDTNCYSKQSITVAKKKSIPLKVPAVPIALAPKPPRKILPQVDLSTNIRWTKGQPHQVVHILQNGDQYHSVEKLNSEQLRVVTDAISSVGPTPNNQNKVLYDPTSKTRVVYRVVYPEDLNLCSGKDSKSLRPAHTRAKTPPPVIHYKNIIIPKKSPKTKHALAMASPTSQVVSVTRSGRRVRPPRHMALDFEQEDADGSTPTEIAPGLLAIPDPPTNEVTVKKRIVCPACDKTYHSEKRIGKHLMTFPDHALTEKTEAILKKYKLENPPKEILPPNEKAQIANQNEKNPTIVSLETNQPKNTEIERDMMNSITPMKQLKEDKSVFGSLTRIIEHTSEEYRASVFIRQLAALTVKLRKLMPCLLFRDVGSSPCLINEPVGKILDLTPGKYHLNMSALKCSGIGGENCTHCPLPTPKENVTVESNVSSNNTWIANTNIINNENKEVINDFMRSSAVNDWTSNTAKRKWIPIGSQSDSMDEPHVTDDSNWIPNKSRAMIDSTPSFSQRVDSIKTWDSNIQKQCHVSQTSSRSPWNTGPIEQLPKMDLPQEILSQNLILNTSNQTIQNDDSSSFDCTDKIDDLHSNLVYDMKDQLDSSIDLKNSLSCNSQSTRSSDETGGPENFDFNDSRFDLQINSDKLNFSNSEYSEMKYGALPPFRKIEPAKNLQLPLDALGDISSDGDKLHNNILNNGNYPITSESLGLKIDNSRHIQTIDASVNSHKNISINEVNQHCNNTSLLTDSELNLPISVSNTLSTNVSMLSVSESSMDGGRMNLSTSQSVLHLLDPLGTDCLSFTDAELRPTSQMSLDLQLDLFPFHHP